MLQAEEMAGAKALRWECARCAVTLTEPGGQVVGVEDIKGRAVEMGSNSVKSCRPG